MPKKHHSNSAISPSVPLGNSANLVFQAPSRWQDSSLNDHASNRPRSFLLQDHVDEPQQASSHKSRTHLSNSDKSRYSYRSTTLTLSLPLAHFEVLFSFLQRTGCRYFSTVQRSPLPMILDHLDFYRITNNYLSVLSSTNVSRLIRYE